MAIYSKIFARVFAIRSKAPSNIDQIEKHIERYRSEISFTLARTDTAVVSKRRPAGPADPKADSIGREFGASAIGDSGDRCRGSVSSIRIPSIYESGTRSYCQHGRPANRPCTGPPPTPPHISLSEHVRAEIAPRGAADAGERRERAVASARVTHGSPPRFARITTTRMYTGTRICMSGSVHTVVRYPTYIHTYMLPRV